MPVETARCGAVVLALYFCYGALRAAIAVRLKRDDSDPSGASISGRLADRRQQLERYARWLDA